MSSALQLCSGVSVALRIHARSLPPDRAPQRNREVIRALDQRIARRYQITPTDLSESAEWTGVWLQRVADGGIVEGQDGTGDRAGLLEQLRAGSR